MADQGNLRKMLQERRLTHQLELQSRQIESVLSKHEVPAQVAGGYVQHRSIRFDLSAHLESGLERLRHIKQELLVVLGVAEAELIGEGEYWQLHIARPENPPVSLLDMLAIIEEIPPLSILLGMAENGHPLLVELAKDDLTNILIAGSENAGKSSLLRTVALSLSLTHKQSQCQMVIMDAAAENGSASYSKLEPLTFLPHLLAPVVYDEEDFQNMITFLVDELAYRQEQAMDTPAIVVLVDEVVALLQQLPPHLADGVTRLLHRGPEVGIFTVMTTKTPESALLNRTIRLKAPVRLVGRTADAQMSEAAADMAGSQAEYLLGEGDFIAVVDDRITHFQAAYIGDYDLHLSLETLHRNRPQALVAAPYKVQSLAASLPEAADAQRPFEMKPSGVHMGPP